ARRRAFAGRLGVVFHRTDDDPGLEPSLGVLDHDLAREAGHLVEFFAHGHVLHDVLVLHPSRELGEDGVGEGVPLHQHRARLDPLVRLDLDLGPVHDGIALALAPAFVGHRDLAVAVGGHQVTVAVHDRAQVVVLHHPRTLGLVLGRLGHAAGRAADVEGAHGELGPRLTDGLGRDDADGFAQLGQAAGAEVAAVAHDADAALGVTGQGGANADTFQSGFFDLLRELLGNLGVGLGDDLAREQVTHVLGRHPAQDAVLEGLDDV